MTNVKKMQVCLGSVIRDKRKAKGFSQESFADEIGLHRTYVGSVERGERNVSLANLIRVSEALGMPLSVLISEAESICAK